MLSIFVLEDDLKQQSRIEDAILKYVKEDNISYQLEIFGKPDQLLNRLDYTSRSVFLLDIEIKDSQLKGLEVAKMIRQKDSFSVIAFVTTHSEFMPLTYQYQVAAYDFIDKNDDEEKFFNKVKNVLSYAIAHQDDSNEAIFCYKNGYKEVIIPYSRIYYIETSATPHKLILHGEGEYMEFYGKISEIASDHHFFQCHRSILVNKNKIRQIDSKERKIYFPDGQSCLFSSIKKKEIERLLDALSRGNYD